MKSTVNHPKKFAKHRGKSTVSRSKLPTGMSLDEWQTAIRREDAIAQKMRVVKTGQEVVFADYHVWNPATGGKYQVTIWGHRSGENRCSCLDYGVNGLGTCKHIERVLTSIRRNPRNHATLLEGFHPSYCEVYLRYSGVREVVLRLGRNLPNRLKNFVGEIFGTDGVLKIDQYDKLSMFQREMKNAGVDCRIESTVLNHVARVLDEKQRKMRIKELFPRGEHSAAFDSLLKTDLYPYQREGALFAANAGRCLIADDMGLGKTIQSIAAVEILARAAGLERVLIVCPTSLKHQWKEEIAKFAGRPTIVVEGGIRERIAAYAIPSFYKVVNYDVLHRDLKDIKRWEPGMIILDEAQRIKNWRTRVAKATKRLESDYALVLTGTPLENRLEELHSIIEFVDRFHLGASFRFLAAHQMVDETGQVTGYRNLSQISETLKPILIRRTKKEVLAELPPRLEKSFFVPLTKPQSLIHGENSERVSRIVSKWKSRGFLTEIDQLHLRMCLQNMRMVCNSTYLVDHKSDHGSKADELLTLLNETFEKKDVKVVVFSQWLRTHELIEKRIKGKPWNHVLFHGTLSSKERAKRIKQFKEDSTCRLFLSTDAGGTGLNLQNASVVVNMDQPWNPAVLEQRIGRVHRMGQKQSVRVVNFITENSIEQGMLSLLSFKRSVFEGVLDGGASEVFIGKGKLNRFMETVEKATQVSNLLTETKGSEHESVMAAKRDEMVRQSVKKEIGRNPISSPAASPEQSWNGLLEAGVGFLEKLGSALRDEKSSESVSRSISALVGEDTQTGQRYLKLPLPDMQVLDRLTGLLKDLAGKK